MPLEDRAERGQAALDVRGKRCATSHGSDYSGGKVAARALLSATPARSRSA
jgi:hypothetical protein